MAIHLPAAKQVRDLLTTLLGRAATLGATSPFAPGPWNPATFGVYVDESWRVAALVVLDLRLSAYVAAARGLLPPGGADDVVDDRRLTVPLREHLHEILDSAAGLFDAPDADRLRLHAVHHAGVAAPADLQARALTLGRREDLTVDVAGYGKGRFSIILT